MSLMYKKLDGSSFVFDFEGNINKPEIIKNLPFYINIVLGYYKNSYFHLKRRGETESMNQFKDLVDFLEMPEKKHTELAIQKCLTLLIKHSNMLFGELNQLPTEHVIACISLQESRLNGTKNEIIIEIIEREVICKIFLITSFIIQHYFDKLHIKSYQLEDITHQIIPFRR